MGFNGYSWKADKNGKFNERLAFYIIKKNKRLEEIEKNTGITIGSISNWCSGRYSPSIENTVKLCEFLGISIKSLFGGKK